jgi:hypothetical protein
MSNPNEIMTGECGLMIVTRHGVKLWRQIYSNIFYTYIV